MQKHKFSTMLTLLLVVSFATSTTDAWTSQNQNFETVQDIAVSSDYIYVAERNVVHLLHTNLSHHSSLRVGSNSISKITLNTDKSAIIICLVDGLCKACNIQSLLEDSPAQCASVVATIPWTESIALGAASDSTFYVGSEGYIAQNVKRSIILRQFKYGRHAASQLRTSGALTVTNQGFRKKEFHDVFLSKKHVYYIAVDAIGRNDKLIVMRACAEANNEYFSAITEIELDYCGVNETVFNFTYSSLESNIMGGSEVLVIVSNGRNGGQICMYDLAVIEQEVHRAYYNECINNKGPLPWIDYDATEDCSSFVEVLHKYRYCLYVIIIIID